MWSFLVILYVVVLVQNGHSIGLHYDNQQPLHPQAQLSSMSSIPRSDRYQCTCTDGITTKVIPINENDERVSFITSYFNQPMQPMQPMQGMVSMGKPMYPSMPDFGGNLHFKPPGLGGIGGMGGIGGIGGMGGIGGIGGFGQGLSSSDCLNSAFGKLSYGASPCLNMMKYIYPGMSGGMVPGLPMSYPGQSQMQMQGGMFGGNMRPYSSANVNWNQNMNGNLNGPYSGTLGGMGGGYGLGGAYGVNGGMSGGLNYNGNLGMNGGFQVPRLSVVGQVTQPNPTTAYVNFKSNLPGANGEAGSSEKDEGGSGTPSDSESKQ